MITINKPGLFIVKRFMKETPVLLVWFRFYSDLYYGATAIKESCSWKQNLYSVIRGKITSHIRHSMTFIEETHIKYVKTALDWFVPCILYSFEKKTMYFSLCRFNQTASLTEKQLNQDLESILPNFFSLLNRYVFPFFAFKLGYFVVAALFSYVPNTLA